MTQEELNQIYQDFYELTEAERNSLEDIAAALSRWQEVNRGDESYICANLPIAMACINLLAEWEEAEWNRD